MRRDEFETIKSIFNKIISKNYQEEFYGNKYAELSEKEYKLARIMHGIFVKKTFSFENKIDFCSVNRSALLLNSLLEKNGKKYISISSVDFSEVVNLYCFVHDCDILFSTNRQRSLPSLYDIEKEGDV